jgi:LPS export ABC transporter protein LptC
MTRVSLTRESLKATGMAGRWFSVAMVCFLLVFSACSLLFGESESEDEEVEGGIERYPDLIMRGFIRSAVDQRGNLLWQIKAREGRVFNDSNHIYLTDFIFYSFDENDGSLRSTLRARRGFMDNNTETLTARLDVVLRSENGRVLETEEAHANNRERIIYNEILNRITQEDGTVMIGTHLWAHSDLGVFRLQMAQGEAPEGAEGDMFGSGGGRRESDSDASPDSRPADTGDRTRPTDPSASQGGGGIREPSGAGASPGSLGNLFPEYDEDRMEQLRSELAFPQSMRVVPLVEEQGPAQVPESPQESGVLQAPESPQGSAEGASSPADSPVSVSSPVEGVLANEEYFEELSEGEGAE